MDKYPIYLFLLLVHCWYLHGTNSYLYYLYLYHLSPLQSIVTFIHCLVISVTNGSVHSHHSYFQHYSVRNVSRYLSDPTTDHPDQRTLHACPLMTMPHPDLSMLITSAPSFTNSIYRVAIQPMYLSFGLQ